MFKKDCQRLQNFSISFLAIALGLGGLTLAWQRAEIILGLSFFSYVYLLYITIFVFALIMAIYLIKSIRYPQLVKQEFLHPVKVNFFPVSAIMLLIISIIFLDINLAVSRNLWLIGASWQLVFSLVILSMWIRRSKFQTKHLSPAWFIPIVGSVIVPIAGTAHGFIELSWFFFSIGLVMWVALFSIVLNRLIFHDPMPDKLLPTFFILFAPPAVAFIAYIKLTGSLDSFARILYYIAVFLFLLIMMQFTMFTKIKFYLSWWAYSFPMAAIAIATMLMYHLTDLRLFAILAKILFGGLLLIVGYLSYKTLQAIKNEQICVVEAD